MTESESRTPVSRAAVRIDESRCCASAAHRARHRTRPPVTAVVGEGWGRDAAGAHHLAAPRTRRAPRATGARLAPFPPRSLASLLSIRGPHKGYFEIKSFRAIGKSNVVDFGKATMVFNNSFLCRGHNLVRELWERFSGKITQGNNNRRNH